MSDSQARLDNINPITNTHFLSSPVCQGRPEAGWTDLLEEPTVYGTDRHAERACEQRRHPAWGRVQEGLGGRSKPPLSLAQVATDTQE